MSNQNLFLSIITPSYNRAHLLSQCYKSLCVQTDRDFEWLIIDDGSQDNTEQVVQSFDTSLFPIIYIKKENGGKHTALNTSHPYIHGKFVLILDSDDYLIPSAVEQVRKVWAEYDKRAEIGVLTFLRGHNISDPLCTAPITDTPVDILRCKRKIIHSSDCCEVIRTELFKKYPFPVFEGERFVAECALWNRVAKTHQCVYINEVIYICEYLEGGLSKSGRTMRIRNPQGGMFTSDLRMGKNNYFTQRIKYGLLYCCYGFFARLKILDILSGTKNKLIAAICLLPGYFIFKHWTKLYS